MYPSYVANVRAARPQGYGTVNCRALFCYPMFCTTYQYFVILHQLTLNAKPRTYQPRTLIHF
ncbi:hypothetical protein PISMIDRAFT_690224 [Pisolithus microcarpus 441]|uniref:Unplaced genomic scaffold scaffold_500, whole genome shotgun sequence n=1 Tax=Pisolithus microcarpus 441 TaxID=765257 RepID=A0A0C9YUR2_9AGAM|nr:hypothetical protein BKA83DRAFT_690224 [Pisolithus microcarpus]KIK11598.1 hypothetical protein PISMIDRAFT_690224 [Pisolithus microcarpus 441]